MAAVVATRHNPTSKPFMSACLPVTKSKMCALGAPVRKLVYYALAYSERVGLTRITTPKSLDAQDGIRQHLRYVCERCFRRDVHELRDVGEHDFRLILIELKRARNIHIIAFAVTCVADLDQGKQSLRGS